MMSNINNQSNMTLPMQLNQQMMTSSAATAVGLTSPVHLLPASASNWMVPSYPMMVLQQGIGQSLFGQNVLALQDGHVMLAPVDDSTANHQMAAETGSGGVLLQANKAGGKTAHDQWQSSKLHSSKGTMDGEQMMQQQIGNGATAGANNAQMGVAGRNSQVTAAAALAAGKMEVPKKPLTPYMLFSKTIWPHVKAANSHLSSVCEIGAVIGSLWRDMDPKEKQRYNDLFARDKERYDKELRAYLKITGLHASDLAKQPKPKRSRGGDNKSSTAWSSASSATFSPSSQQHVGQAVPGTTAGSGDALRQPGSAADMLPTFSQAWTSQAGSQLTAQQAQQVLTHLGLTGQTLYANSDGSISIGSNNMSNLLALPSQPSVQLVSVSGESVMAVYSDQRAGISSQSSTATSGDTSGQLDVSTSSWVGHDGGGGGGGGGVLLYHLPSSSSGMKAELKGQGQDDGTVFNQSYSSSADQRASLVKQEGGDSAADASSRDGQLRAELHQMRCALMEKTREVGELTDKLKEAYDVIDRYKQLTGGGGCGDDELLTKAGQIADGEDGANAADDGSNLETAPTTEDCSTPSGE